MATKKTPSTKRKKPIRLAPAPTPVDWYSAIDDLLTRAKRGDEAAAHELLSVARAACHNVGDMAVSPETKEITKKLASEELTWPVVASRFGRMEGNAKSVEFYLEEIIDLGSAWNLDPKVPRHPERMEIPWLIFRALRSRGVPLHRGSMGRDEWLASPNGRTVKKEIRAELDRLFGDRWPTRPERPEWEKCPVWVLSIEAMFAPFVAEADRQRKRRSVAILTPRALRSGCVEAIAKDLHGMIFD